MSIALLSWALLIFGTTCQASDISAVSDCNNDECGGDAHGVSLLQVSMELAKNDDNIPVKRVVNGVPLEVDVGREGPFGYGRIIEQSRRIPEATPRSAAIYALVCLVYVSLCVWYQVSPRSPRKVGEDVDKNRALEWDFVKFVLMCNVITVHLGQFVFQGDKEHGRGRLGERAWFMAYTMPAFVFISGVFSASISRKSLMMTVVGLPCTLLLFDVLVAFVTVLLPGGLTIQIGRSGVDWFLQCLIVWRLVIPALFKAAKKLHISSVVPCLVACIACWMLWSGIRPQELQVDLTVHGNGTDQHVPKKLPEAARPYFTLFPWRLLISFGPLFALGLMATPDEWLTLFSDERFSVAAYAFASLYLTLVTVSPAFSHWFDCTFHDSRDGVEWPTGALTFGLTFKTFCTFARVFTQRVFLIFTSIGVIMPVMGLLKRWAPDAARFIAGCGSRSIYPYLLHWALVVVPGCRTMFGKMQAQMLGAPPWGPNLTLAVLYVIVQGFCWNLILSCPFSEMMFAWLFKTPVWITQWLSATRRPEDACEAKGEPQK